MRVLLCVVLAALVVSMGAGCGVMAMGPVVAPIGIDVKGPAAGVDNSVEPMKQGSATAQGVLIIGWGDASLEAAMKDGGIQRVHHADTRTLNILGIYAEHETIVYGE